MRSCSASGPPFVCLLECPVARRHFVPARPAAFQQSRNSGGLGFGLIVAIRLLRNCGLDVFGLIICCGRFAGCCFCCLGIVRHVDTFLSVGNDSVIFDPEVSRCVLPFRSGTRHVVALHVFHVPVCEVDKTSQPGPVVGVHRRFSMPVLNSPCFPLFPRGIALAVVDVVPAAHAGEG